MPGRTNLSAIALLLLATASSSDACAAVVLPGQASHEPRGSVIDDLGLSFASDCAGWSDMTDSGTSPIDGRAPSPVIGPEVPEQKAFQGGTGGGASRTSSHGPSTSSPSPATAESEAYTAAGGSLVSYLPRLSRCVVPFPLLSGIFRPPREETVNLAYDV